VPTFLKFNLLSIYLHTYLYLTMSYDHKNNYLSKTLCLMVKSISVPENSTHFKRRLVYMPHLFNHSILTPNNADANILQAKPIIFPSVLWRFEDGDNAILLLCPVGQWAIFASFAMSSHVYVSSLVESRDSAQLSVFSLWSVLPWLLWSDYVLYAGFWIRRQAIELL